jgi:DnaJ domain
MPTLIAGVLALYLLLLAIRRFAQLSPASAVAIVRNAGAVAVFVVAGFLLLRGNFAGAATFAAIATSLGLVGRRGRLASVLGAVGFGPRPGRVTTARSAMIEMRLDQDSGVMSGTALAGAQQGRDLDTLTRGECLALYEDCRRDDPEGARLLETYLDRRFAGWRQADEGQGEERRRNDRGGAMTRDQAYQILGLAQGASAEEIIRAHRSLMQKLHPDHGGSTALAAQVNEAKDVLLRHV